MLLRLLLALAPAIAARAVIVDRTAIIVDRKPILDSDIARDIRLTAFLNNTRADFSASSRKAAGSRLIDQALLRQQIQVGGYPIAAAKETGDFLNQIVRDRFGTEAAFKRSLAEYGITLNELRDRLSWQLTVLNFIDTRFRPQAAVSDDEVQQYYEAHRTQFASKPLADVRPQITEQISGVRINKLLNDWLDQTRKSTRIRYLEKSLS